MSAEERVIFLGETRVEGSTMASLCRKKVKGGGFAALGG